MAFSKLKVKIHEIIFEADTKEGKLFDVVLLLLILISIIATMLETVNSIRDEHGELLLVIEWIATIFFTIEYILRIYSSKEPLAYIFSFYGVVDLLSIFPTYLSVLYPSTRSLAVIRSLRLLRVFRVLKLGQFLTAYESLKDAVKESKNKIFVFLAMVVIIVFIVGSLMYVIEGNQVSGFDNIPISVYWAIVTVTTVGYGDIAPVTPLGQVFASILMIVGYAIIAIPTGIVGAGIISAQNKESISLKHCHHCDKEDHRKNAKYCYNCGESIIYD
jgi:voltage-gated potassium channel